MLAIQGLLKHGQPNDTSNTKRLIRDTFTEFLATTLFVFNGTLSASSTQRAMTSQGSKIDVSIVLPIAMAFGVSIMVLAFSIGHITGGHMNPGVSLTMFFRRQLSGVKLICYWVAQFIGGILGASLTWGCISGLQGEQMLDSVYPSPPFNLGSTTLFSGITTGNGLLLEFMGSFFFYFIIAQTALDKRGIAGSMFPAIPIGFSLIVVHICLIPFTGCGVNPARTLGPSAVVCMSGGDCDSVMGSWYWIYWVGPFAAAYAVAEITLLLEMDVDGKSAEETTKEEEGLLEVAAKTTEKNVDEEQVAQVADA